MKARRSPRVVVREPTVDDSLGIARVLVDSWFAAYQGILPDQLLAGQSVIERQRELAVALATPAPVGAVRLVAELGGEVVGFVNAGAVSPGAAGDTDTAEAAQSTAELAILYVAPKSWRQGVGRRLLRRALIQLDDAGFTEAQAWVFDGNESAFAFFDSQGWARTAVSRTEVLDGHTVDQTRLDFAVGV